MIRRYRIRDSLGVHARPAAKLVKALASIPGSVVIEYDGRRVNAKSILEVMSLGIRGGESFALECEADQIDALDRVDVELLDILSSE
ncbi:HPr family phosphocarrier protein [Sulfobacillus harzensis]|uniref:Phosphocarrier protein HPr n=1 Tax=Sulfobacillus harzensis TaxID=2729629 RepID=A0A7Y0L5I7_9FIRM|nr:HPr family phosphocarrier protein [Sulfobacillus harzensis]NMP22254.1 HPr family phosphocarrier protein [Sulfobacillus harzensis]